MLDYMTSRENFLDVGEQYTYHLTHLVKEWKEFVDHYNDANKKRVTDDKDYQKKQFIGEELDWKMLADNLSLFQSEINDL